ncbi:hypothetical protein [Sneathiella sp. HT1-7]|uniref:hypothetical protein n=1 Tax=Sneathiella sp. HT1-7 TaxID=2887192 RepID=UPI001D15757C|nr:hypothetical protein [Sneathiella sp. HT1-7]MCC3306269.1 hypothetical protein [Sneathiella sp. HT1-7]
MKKGKLSIEMIIGIADYFTQLDVHWLLTGEGPFLNPVAYDEGGWSIPRERHSDYHCLLNVLTLIEEKLREDWLGRQKGLKRKSDLLSYFYEKYFSTFIEAKEDKKLSMKQAHGFASVELTGLMLWDCRLLGIES